MQGGFEFKVSDDGKGFDKAAVVGKGKGSGLNNIMKRSGLAGLECTLTTEPGKGCLYILKKSSILA